MEKKGIPGEVRQEVETIIERFNKEVFQGVPTYYQARFRGKYLYLDLYDEGTTGAVCRLAFHGKMDNWEFAIFKWSDEKYDADEFMFPGAEEVNGTIEGAMRAGLAAYPL